MDLNARFVANVSTGNAPLVVTFTNVSSGPFTRVEWDFGDGNKSVEISPTHTFNSVGAFTVTLTIFSADGQASSAQQTIVVLAEQSVSTGNTEVQQALFTFKRFEPGQVAVRRVTTTGTTFESNFPISAGTSTIYSDVQHQLATPTPLEGAFFNYFVVNVDESFTGGNIISYDNVGDVDDFLDNATDSVVAIVLSTTGTSDTNVAEWNDNYDQPIGNAVSLPSSPVLFYRVVDHDFANKVITVDREVLNTLDSGGHCAAYVIGLCGDTQNYGENVSPGTSSVGVSIGVDAANQLMFPGIDFDTFSAASAIKGFYSYVANQSESGACFSVLYPENTASTTNRFYPGETKLVLPWLLWHEKFSPGLRIYDTADSTQRDPATNLRFRYLRAGQTQNDQIVGKVFYDKQLLLIDDPEISAALMYQNDRSWTLPAPDVKFVSSNEFNAWVTGGTAPTGVSWYWTYRVVERDPSDGSWPTSRLGGDYLGYGEKQAGLPCQYIQRVDVQSGESSGGYFTMTIPRLLQATGGTDCVVNGNPAPGFVASWIELYAATGATDASGPDMDSWRVMTGVPAEAAWTGNFATTTTINININSSFRYDLSGETYSWADTNLSGSATQQIGNEPSPWAFLETTYATDVYKTSAVCVAKNNEFNQTQNATHDASTNEYVYVTEVGLYNESNELLMVGKLSKPIPKNDQEFITIKLELDL